MSLQVCGNSHVVALIQATPPPGADFPVFGLGNGRFETAPFSEVAGDAIRLTNEVYAANLLRHTGADRITRGTTWGFLSVNHSTRVFRDRTWETFEPATVVAPGRQPVSQGVLERILERDHTGVRLLLEQALQIGLSFFVVSAPPPRRDHPALQRVRPEVAAHIDRSTRAVWAGWLAERGIAIVQPPPESFAPDGFLDERFNVYVASNGRQDHHHANPAYGALMRARIAAHHRQVAIA